MFLLLSPFPHILFPKNPSVIRMACSYMCGEELITVLPSSWSGALTEMNLWNGYPPSHPEWIVRIHQDLWLVHWLVSLSTWGKYSLCRWLDRLSHAFRGHISGSRLSWRDGKTEAFMQMKYVPSSSNTYRRKKSCVFSVIGLYILHSHISLSLYLLVYKSLLRD